MPPRTPCTPSSTLDVSAALALQNANNPNSTGSNAGATPVAQLVEQRIPNPQVAGSIPSRRVPNPPSAKSDHSFGIYKFGQGYWVRMMTAVFAGVLALSTAGWAWRSLEAVRPPTPSWILNLEAVSSGGTPKAGELVTLLDTSKTPADKVAAATVKSVEPGIAGREKIIIDKIERELGADGKKIDILSASHISGPPSTTGPGSLWNAQIAQAQGIPAFQIVYVQSVAAIVILLIGGVVVYLFVGHKPVTAEFLIATDGEMRKVNWSTKKIILDSTYVVIAAAILIAGFIFLWDILISNFFKIINVVRG